MNPTSKNYASKSERILHSGDCVYISGNVAIGTMSLADHTVISMIMSERSNRELKKTIIWNDKLLNFQWPIDSGTLIIADADRQAPGFMENSL